MQATRYLFICPVTFFSKSGYSRRIWNTTLTYYNIITRKIEQIQNHSNLLYTVYFIKEKYVGNIIFFYIILLPTYEFQFIEVKSRKLYMYIEKYTAGQIWKHFQEILCKMKVHKLSLANNKCPVAYLTDELQLSKY